jgi:hypothetical protein
MLGPKKIYPTGLKLIDNGFVSCREVERAPTTDQRRRCGLNVMGCEAAMWIVSALRRERKRRGPGEERD